MKRDSARPVALITGCSSGLGRALALELMRREHEVVATARVPAALAELSARGARTMRLDVTAAADVESVVAEASAGLGRIDMLVNNAGYGLIGPAAELAPGEIPAMLLHRQLSLRAYDAEAMMVRSAMPGSAEMVGTAVPSNARRA